MASEDVSVSLKTISDCFLDRFNYVVFVMEARCAFCELGNEFCVCRLVSGGM